MTLEQQALLNKIYDGLAKSGLNPADYMAIIRLIQKIVLADEPVPRGQHD